ncbi:tetratricopeptide repeat protein [Fulvivirgaceae bacterium PWU4]|uniref:Oxygen sensor histidine kinase NreB n=1 Tax=Chryseosolibacter histidini TaxID=2782349 RepID=A0AAP2DLS6_9BACT|nr:tetratricopeptide repeat protein [Chryseosolibacter histidini]MBT1698716.1 tetratricopeptide repeat protein [Chryseosolibacter histidini]
MRYLFFSLLLVYTKPLLSQSTEADPKQLNDSAVYHYDRSHFDKAWEFASQANARAEALHLQDELFRSHAMLGNVASRRGHLREAQRHHRRSLAIARDDGDANRRAKALSSLASVLSTLGEYDSATMLLNEILTLGQIDREVLMTTYGRLGVNQKRQQQYDKAIGHYLQSLTIAKALHDSLASARTLANIGNIYFEQKDPARALQYYLDALSLLDSAKHNLSISGISVFASDAYQALKQYDEAERYLQRSLAITRKLNLPNSEAYALESLGILHFNRRQVHEAIDAFQKALALHRNLDAWSSQESVLLQLSECYLHTGQLREARAMLDEGRLIAEKHKHTFGLRNAYRMMARLDSAQGNFRSALAHYQRSVHYKDSLFTVEKAKAVEEINKKFEAQEKGRVIAEQERIIEQQRTKELFFLMLIGVLLLSACVIYFFIRRRQRLKHEMLQEQQRKEKLLAIVIAQEQMQQKIARDLHDGFVQIFAAAKINLESVKAMSTSPALSGKLQETASIIDQAARDARTISHQLLPYSLEKHGLIAAIQELLDKNPKKGSEEYIFKHGAITERYKNTLEINVYRIVQELINNIIKHAAARRIQVFLSQQHQHLVLSVSDDGKGFDVKHTASGAGLLNIESRLQSLRGVMRIESQPGMGTTTVVEIPLT